MDILNNGCYGYVTLSLNLKFMKSDKEIDYSKTKTIDISNKAEVIYWSRALNISSETLPMLVHEIGDEIENVKYYQKRINLQTR